MEKRMMIIALLLTLLGVTSLVPIQAQEDATDLEEIPFFLTFVPNIQFVPVYATIANGHAADVGLELVIEHGDENIGMDLIANNTLQFGMMSGEQVIMARAGGRPVVYIYEWFQQYPVGIVVPDTTEAETVDALHDLKVGIPGRFGASYSGLTALLAAHEMDENDIQLEAIGFAAPDVVCVGGVDASVVYINNEPLQIQQRADAGECGDITHVRIIPVADYADMVSNGLVTNEEVIAENPELVTAIVNAFDNGLRDVINDPAGAYLLSLDFVEGLPIDDDFRAALEAASAVHQEFLNGAPTREEIAESRSILLDDLSQQFDNEMLIQFRVLLATIELWDADQRGYTDPASWEVTLDILEMMEMLSGEVVLEGVYTNEFVTIDE
jgi:NitT/TauT family transport system substrate-binding protein